MKLKVNESFTNPKETNPEKLAKTVMGWYDFDTNYIDDGGQRRTAEKKNQNTLEWFNEHPLELKQKAYKILLSKVHSSEKAKVQNTFGKLISEVSATPNTNELKMKNIKETIKSIVKEESEYEVFFRKALDKAGKKITDMNDDEKKAFFTKIDNAWTGKGEKNEGNTFGAERAKAIANGDDSFKVDGKPFKVTGVDAEDKENAKKFSNENTELPKATIPAAVQAKLDMAIDKIKDTKLSYNQKLSLIGKVMDGLGVDKGEFNKMASKLKGTMESVITEQLVPVDKKAVDAFFDKKPFEGKNLNSDGMVLKTVGVGSQEMFAHTPNGVKFVGKVTGKYAQSLLQYVNKNFKGDLTEIIKSYKPGDGEYIAKIYSGHLKGDERYSHALTVVDVLHANGLVTKAVAKQMEQELANSLARLRKSRSENVNEGNAFGMAVNAAKKEGLKEFEFNGKMYKVKTGSYEKNEAAKKPVVLSGFTLVPEKKK